MLLGRAAEIERITDLIGAARAGESNVLVLEGEPGIGKSTLLDFACDHADGALILQARATESDSEIPYVHLADLIRPIADRLPTLQSRQAAALEGVLALGTATAPDRLVVATATLSMLDLAAADRAVLVLVDDMQWVDRFSFEVIAFVARRLRAEGILVILTVRPGHPVSGLETFQHLMISGLTEPAARELVESTGKSLGEAVVARLLEESAGNPLALVELPALLAAQPLQAGTPGSHPLPVGTVIGQAFAQHVRTLPQQTQDALLVLAILGSVPPAIVWRVLDAIRLEPTALDPAEEVGLIRDDGLRLVFRHPLIRAAVYQISRPSKRRRFHGFAAEALRGAAVPNAVERRAWHLVSASTGPDGEIADELEATGQREWLRGNFALAGTLFTCSAEITPVGPQVSQRLLRAANAIRLAGAVSEAYDLTARAAAADDGEIGLLAGYYVCRMDIWRSNAVDGRDRLLRLANSVAPAQPEVACLMYAEAALATVEIGELKRAVEVSGQAVALAPDPDELPLAVEIIRALALALVGADGADQHLRRRAADVDDIDPLALDLADQLILVAAVAHLTLEQVDRSRELLQHCVSRARDASAVGVLPFRLGRLGWVHFWSGQWTAAYAVADEALRLAEDTGWVSERPNSLAVLARIEALTGRDDDCRAHAEAASVAAAAAGILTYQGYAHAALGALALSNGDPERAVQHLSAVDDHVRDDGLVDSPMLWWSADLAEAYFDLGQDADMRAVIERLEASLRSSGRPTAAAVAARCRAMLEPDDFDRYMAQAMRWHAKSQAPFERARTELTLGTGLRRRRQVDKAREHLTAALATFERLDARRWADRAREELRTIGVQASEPEPLVQSLTPQELNVAMMVAEGMANREVAAQLFLSVKTVEFHLANVYHKLGVRRRTQLSVLLARRGAGREP